MVKYSIFVVLIIFLFLLILIVTGMVFSGKKEKQKLETDEKKRKLQKDIAEIIPVIGYDQDNHCYRMKDKKCMDIIQINSKDLINSSADDVEYDCLKFAKTYKLYEEDVKLLVLNFPCDTSGQQEYLRHKLVNTSNEVYKHFLHKKLDELVWIGNNNTTREFYFMLFADSAEELQKQILTLKTVLHLGKDGLLILLPEEKKHQILFRINNKNSLVI